MFGQIGTCSDFLAFFSLQKKCIAFQCGKYTCHLQMEERERNIFFSEKARIRIIQSLPSRALKMTIERIFFSSSLPRDRTLDQMSARLLDCLSLLRLKCRSLSLCEYARISLLWKVFPSLSLAPFSPFFRPLGWQFCFLIIQDHVCYCLLVQTQPEHTHSESNVLANRGISHSPQFPTTVWLLGCLLVIFFFTLAQLYVPHLK